MDSSFRFSYSEKMEDIIDNLVDICHDAHPNDHIIVYDFGENRNLLLDIYKDEDYNPEYDEEISDLVDIVTSKEIDGIIKPIDDSLAIYVTDGELYRTLERLWFEKNMHLLDETEEEMEYI